MKHPAPSPTVIDGTPHNHSGEDNLADLRRVVIHSAVMPNAPGAARRLGEWNRDGTTGGSWHYSTDADETYQCSYDRFVCWHAPPNRGSIGIEMADGLDHKRIPNLLNRARWLLPRHARMLRRTARLTARLCLAYDLPLLLLTVEGARAGRKGIATHDTISRAFGESTHSDPGAWPSKRFLRLTRRYARHLIDTRK